MSSLYIDSHSGLLRMVSGAIGFWEDGQKKGSVPLASLSRVVMVGSVNLETGVLHALAQRKVSVVFLSGRQGRFLAALVGPMHRNGKLRLAQYRAVAGEEKATIASRILHAKLTAQEEALAWYRQERPKAAKMMTSATRVVTQAKEALVNADVGRLRGLEGAASAACFGAFKTLVPPSLNFTGRHRRPPPDPVNALLSLGYTLLFGEFLKEVNAIGLDPTLGFLHEFDYGRDSLALDLMEPWRPQWERWVFVVFRDRMFRDRDFGMGGERAGCWLKKGPRQRFYQEFERWAQPLRPAFRQMVYQLIRWLGEEEMIETENENEKPVP